MAVFVSGFKQDIFISYAPVDNEKIVGTNIEGWVTTLINTLEKELAKKLGSLDKFSLWIDYKSLSGNVPITENINEKLKSCAVFVPIVSSGYIASEKCKSQLKTFLEVAGRNSGRLFMVEHEFIEQQEKKEELDPLLEELQGYQFWMKNQDTNRINTLGFPKPNPEREPEYYLQITDLANSIVGKLKQMRNENITPMPDKTNGITISPENTDKLLITSKPDEFKSKKIIRLHKRFKSLDQQLGAAYTQLDSTLNAADKVVLQNQITELEQEIQTIENDLKNLE
ncbi:TIR domain-containing protein [Candidatus Halobeggiatoa sp. HSG11]|nr:TIR domain-containing protein [Candidatus Halobeggiatoa sp. HSG11]